MAPNKLMQLRDSYKDLEAARSEARKAAAAVKAETARIFSLLGGVVEFSLADGRRVVRTLITRPAHVVSETEYETLTVRRKKARK